MWIYEKTLQFPVVLRCKDLRMAKLIMTQLGGPNGEMAAALRYLQQRYTMPTGKTKGLLTDIGTEELAHVEIISSMLYQLTEDATPEEMKALQEVMKENTVNAKSEKEVKTEPTVDPSTVPDYLKEQYEINE